MTLTGSALLEKYDDCDNITFNIHREIYMDINKYSAGDMVETAEGNIGLVIKEEDHDRQGFIKYQIMIEGKKYIYSALELYVLGSK